MANLTPQEIETLVGKLKKYPYLCSFGTDSLGPLAGPPSIEGDIEQKDVTLYETGADVQASFLSKNDVKVTIKTRSIETAMTLMSGFAKGDNIYASANKKTLTLVPITSATGEKTITFSAAYLQPGLSFTPGENDDPSEVSLTFVCKADATNGKPWTYATGNGGTVSP